MKAHSMFGTSWTHVDLACNHHTRTHTSIFPVSKPTMYASLSNASNRQSATTKTEASSAKT
jgi:hypothetical protein